MEAAEEEEDGGGWGFNRQARGNWSQQAPEAAGPPQPVAGLVDDGQDGQVAEGLDAVGPDGARWGFTREARGGQRPPEPAAQAKPGEEDEEEEGDEEVIRVPAEQEDRARQLLTEISDVGADVEDAMEEMRRARVRDRIYDQLSAWAKAHETVAERLDERDPAAAAERRRYAAQLYDICKRFLDTTEQAALVALIDEADPLDPDRHAVALDEATAPEPPEPPEAAAAPAPAPPPSLLETLRSLKQALGAALAADDAPRLLELLQEVAGLKLKWDPVREAAIGKEIGLAAKHADPAVAELAKSLIATLHRLAKTAKAGHSYGR